ncbi:MAG: metal ABC transporter permease [Candidatus Muiribacteriota bacterium]
MEIFDFLTYEFIRHAFISGFIISIPCGIIGSLIVVNKMVFASEGIAHASFGGIGLAIFLGLSPYLGAVTFSIAAALFTAFLTINRKSRTDAATGVVMSLSMAVGIMLINMAPGYATEPMTYLFGNILTVSLQDIIVISVLSIIILFISVFYYKKILAVSYDPVFSEVKGVKVRFYYYLIYLLIGLSVIVVVKISGIVLFIALLTIPPMIVEKYTKNLKQMYLFSSLLTVLITQGGLYFSIIFNLSSGSAIVILAGIIYMLDSIIWGRSVDFSF